MKKIYASLLCLICSCSMLNATVYIVDVQDNFFTPAILNVMVGDTIRWKWVTGNGAHTTTSVTIPAGASAWNSAINSTTPEFDYKVMVPGTYNYQCTLHPGMTGSFTAAISSISENSADAHFILNGNPVKDEVHVVIELNSSKQVHLQLCDIKGAVVKELITGKYAPGTHNETYPVADVAKGIYFLKLEADNSRIIRKLIVTENE